MRWMIDGEERSEKDANSRDTPGGRKKRRKMGRYNLSGFFVPRVDHTTPSKWRLWITVFHVTTFLDLDREAVGGRLRVWVVGFLVALAERLGGGGGVDSNGDREELTERASGSRFLGRSLTLECTCSNNLASGTSSESTAVSVGEFSRLSSAPTPSESTRVTPLTPEEVMEEDLRRCFVARVGALKRSGDDEGDSGEDTWSSAGALGDVPRSMSTDGERVESTGGGELSSVALSGESEALALRARLVRRLGLASSVA